LDQDKKAKYHRARREDDGGCATPLGAVGVRGPPPTGPRAEWSSEVSMTRNIAREPKPWTLKTRLQMRIVRGVCRNFFRARDPTHRRARGWKMSSINITNLPVVSQKILRVCTIQNLFQLRS